MRLKLLVILGLFFWGDLKAQDVLSASSIKSKIDSVRNFVYPGPSSDLLPVEFNSNALENEYYCDSDYYGGHIFILRLRDNHTFIYETFYKPYNWARIAFCIGNYRIYGDTIHITYKSLLPGKADQIYISPTLHVSWIPPRPPEYLFLTKGWLFAPDRLRCFYMLTDKPQFDLESSK